MRVLFSAIGYKPAWNLGGPVLSVAATAERLVSRGHGVTVVTSNSNLVEDLDVPTDRPVDVDGVEVWYFRREEPLQRWLGRVPYLSRSMGYLYCPRMRDAMPGIMKDIDAVDLQSPFVYPSLVAGRAALRFRKPLFYHQRGNFLPSHLRFRRLKKELYIRLFERPLLRRATGLIALTTAERDAFARWADTPCTVIPNGIDPPAVTDDSEVRERLESSLGIPANAVVVFFLGRLHPWKGTDVLIEAFLRISREMPDSRLVIAGPDEWGLEEQWRARAAAADVARQVLFTGVVAGQRKADLLARADLFCLPSMGEGFSLAVLEAMANGTAVLLSPECNFPEVEPAGAGVIASRDVDSVTEALRRLIGNPAALRSMGASARSFVMENYSWDRVADQLIELYERGIASVR